MRIKQLDGLRTLAFLLVFSNHAYQLKLGWFGVDIFFVLSGYLITGILLKQRGKPATLKDFWIKRARRILPPYFMALLFVFVFLPLERPSILHNWPWLVFFATNIGMGTLRFVNWTLGPLWSLAVEEQFYIVWPLVALHASEAMLLRVAWIIVLIAPFLRFFCTPLFSSRNGIYMLTPFRADLLAVGCLFAIYQAQITAPLFKKWLSRIALPLILAGTTTLYLLARLGQTSTGNGRLFNTFGYEGTLCMATGILAYVLCEMPGTQIFKWRFVRYLGTITYMAYLVHVPILQLVHRPLAALVTTFATAALSWYLVESRLVRMNRTRPVGDQLHSPEPV